MDTDLTDTGAGAAEEVEFRLFLRVNEIIRIGAADCELDDVRVRVISPSTPACDPAIEGFCMGALTVADGSEASAVLVAAKRSALADDAADDAFADFRTSDRVRGAGDAAGNVVAAAKGSTMAADDVVDDVFTDFRTSDKVRGAGDAAGNMDAAPAG